MVTFNRILDRFRFLAYATSNRVKSASCQSFPACQFVTTSAENQPRAADCISPFRQLGPSVEEYDKTNKS